MTLASTKTTLQKLLADTENKVVALSGLWGTGKSHLWEQLRKESTDPAVHNALYVSLFGIADMATLKLKVIQSVLPKAGDNAVVTDLAKTAWREGTKVLKKVHAGFAALDEMALLAVPAMLRNRFIVIDDIERKHDKLSIDEIMGFIDEFTRGYGSRMLLILNTDQLVDKEVWDKLREKVIDQEVLLDTSPSEAFDIAIKLSPTKFADQIRESVAACELTNIRVIRKVIRSVDRVLAGHGELRREVLARVIPSTVLLSAMSYKGLVGGPDIAFILGFNSTKLARERAVQEREIEAGKATNDDDTQVRDQQWMTWVQLMDRLGIKRCDEYEQLLAKYLASGSIEIEAVANILGRFSSEAAVLEIREKALSLLDRSQWHPEISATELLMEAEQLAPNIAFLDLPNFDAVEERVRMLNGGEEIADKLVQAWIAAFEASDPTARAHARSVAGYMNSAIRDAIDQAKIAEPKRTLADVVLAIAKRKECLPSEADFLKAATAANFEAEVRRLTGVPFKTFMFQNLIWLTQSDAHIQHLGEAARNFTEACQAICLASTRGRLADLIEELFKARSLEARLKPTAVYPGAAP
jgi:hypothetical protein